jgi:hypothetical protein
MSGEKDTARVYLFGFQIHHIFPAELFDNPKIAAFLNSIGISLGHRLIKPHPDADGSKFY